MVRHVFVGLLLAGLGVSGVSAEDTLTTAFELLDPNLSLSVLVETDVSPCEGKGRSESARWSSFQCDPDAAPGRVSGSGTDVLSSLYEVTFSADPSPGNLCPRSSGVYTVGRYPPIASRESRRSISDLSTRGGFGSGSIEPLPRAIATVSSCLPLDGSGRLLTRLHNLEVDSINGRLFLAVSTALSESCRGPAEAVCPSAEERFGVVFLSGLPALDTDPGPPPPPVPALHLLTADDPELLTCLEVVKLSGQVLGADGMPFANALVVMEIVSSHPQPLFGTFTPQATLTDTNGAYSVDFVLSTSSCSVCVGSQFCSVDVAAVANGLVSNTVTIIDSF